MAIIRQALYNYPLSIPNSVLRWFTPKPDGTEYAEVPIIQFTQLACAPEYT